MNCIYIGTFIKQRRKELKLTQEQVCSGICLGLKTESKLQVKVL